MPYPPPNSTTYLYTLLGVSPQTITVLTRLTNVDSNDVITDDQFSIAVKEMNIKVSSGMGDTLQRLRATRTEQIALEKKLDELRMRTKKAHRRLMITAFFLISIISLGVLLILWALKINS